MSDSRTGARSRLDALPLLDVLDEAFWQDPHTPLREARRHSPVARTPWGSPVLLDHDDCVAALADPRLTNDYDALLTRNDIDDGPLWDWWQLAMLNNNPPAHTRLRSLVSRAFTPRSVARANDIVRRVADDLLAPALERGHIELVREFCEPLPIGVMCELIGVPRGDREGFDRWIADLGLMFSERVTPDMRATAEAAMVDLSAYVDRLVDERQANGDTDDLLGALVAAEAAGDRLSRAELVAMVVNLLFGALDTTRGALSMSVALLAADPSRAEMLRDDEALLAPAVEELLRVEPPAGEIVRMASCDLELRGVPVEAGTPVGISTLAANRVPARFDEPDVVDLRRYTRPATAPILSFGRGIHHCIGSTLARVELREAVGVLLDRCTSIELAGDPPRFVPFLRVRCLSALPLALIPK
jgi:cytochrome P450